MSSRRTVFQDQFRDNQEGATAAAERMRLRKALGEMFPNADRVGTDAIPTVEISTWGNRPRRVCHIHRRTRQQDYATVTHGVSYAQPLSSCGADTK